MKSRGLWPCSVGRSGPPSDPWDTWGRCSQSRPRADSLCPARGDTCRSRAERPVVPTQDVDSQKAVGLTGLRPPQGRGLDFSRLPGSSHCGKGFRRVPRATSDPSPWHRRPPGSGVCSSVTPIRLRHVYLTGLASQGPRGKKGDREAKARIQSH